MPTLEPSGIGVPLALFRLVSVICETWSGECAVRLAGETETVMLDGGIRRTGTEAIDCWLITDPCELTATALMTAVFSESAVVMPCEEYSTTTWPFVTGKTRKAVLLGATVPPSTWPPAELM